MSETKNKFKVWPWLMVVAALVVFYILILRSCWCAAPCWSVLLLLIITLALLIVNALNKSRKKLGWVFSGLLIAMPIITLIFAGSFTWWMWLLVIGLYLLTLLFYFIGVLSETYWSVSILIALFLLLSLIILQVQM